MIQFLVRREAMVDCQDNFNYTPLHYAAVEGHATAARLLLSLGADRTIKEMNGETAKDMPKMKIAFVKDQTSNMPQIHQTSLSPPSTPTLYSLPPVLEVQ